MTLTKSKYALNWDLDSLLPHPAGDEFPKILDQFRRALTDLVGRVEGLPAVGGGRTIPSDPPRPPLLKGRSAAWVAFLKEFETLEAQATDLNAFLGCHAAADAGNKLYRQLEAALSALEPLRERIYTNIEFAFQQAAESDFAAFVESDPWLKSNAFFLQQRRKNAAMRLPKAEELLAADLSVDGIHAWGRLFDRVSGDLRVKVMERGEVVEKSPGQIRFDAAERAIRENNFYAADKAWKTVADHCADALNHISGTRLTLYRRLGLKDHLDMPLHRNRMTRDTLSAMWSAVSRRKSMLLNFLNKKAAMLGLDKPAWFDMTAPLPQASESGRRTEISYDDGADLVIRTFSGFSPHLGDFARHALTRRWIEAENRSGKRQGGFCTGFPTKRESRIFMTYTNTHDDLSTLAHELGHAYHSWVLKDQPLFLQDYPMNLAETASTFAEAVLAEQRLKDSQSRAERLAILDHMLGDAVAFLMNIHARFLFEDNFHKERARGELTAARFSELMLAAQKEAYLDGLDGNGWYPDFWVSKLHFYISGLPFYNFPYTFGYLLSTGLYAVAAEDSVGGFLRNPRPPVSEKPAYTTDFPDQYRRLLIATGCQEAEAAVQSTFGYDLREPHFWNKSLDVIERRVAQFVELSESKSTQHGSR